jgi:glycosyltransferase involved in cell wall biosynthesis
MRAFYLMQELSKMQCNVDLVTSNSNTFLNNYATSGTEVISSTFSFHTITGLKYKSSLLRLISWLEFEVKFLFFKKTRLRKPNIIIISSPSVFTIINGFIWSKVYNAKLVFEVRDIWPLSLTEEAGFSKYNPFIIALSFLEKWSYRVSDLVIGTMPNLKQHVSQISNKKDLKVICVPFGVPDNPLDTLFRADYPIKSGNSNFVIGYVGTVGLTNALEPLFCALKNIDLVSENIKCYIVGSGPLLDFFIKKYGYIDGLYFTGQIKKQDVAKTLASFDILYFSTFKSKVWDHGQSLNKIIDYMLAGKPILGSYSGFASMVNEAQCGWYIEAENSDVLSNKILEISSISKNDLATMGSKGREWILQNRNYTTLASHLKKNISPLSAL